MLKILTSPTKNAREVVNPCCHEHDGKRIKINICLGFFDANFVIGNVLSFLCVFVVYYLESLLIEIDFYEIGLESSIILEYNVCAFQAWRSISVWNEGDLHCISHVLWSSVKFVLSTAKLCTKCLA